MKPLRNWLYRAAEKANGKIKTQENARNYFNQIIEHYEKRGGNIDGWEKTVDMLIQEFFCEDSASLPESSDG